MFETPALAGVYFSESENAQRAFLLLAVPGADIHPAWFTGFSVGRSHLIVNRRNTSCTKGVHVTHWTLIMPWGLGNLLLSQGSNRSYQKGQESQKDWTHKKVIDIYFLACSALNGVRKKHDLQKSLTEYALTETRMFKDARRGPLPGGMSGPQPWYESHRRRRSTMAFWFIAISKAVNCKNSEWPGIHPLITTDGSMYRMKAVIELFCHTLATTWSLHRYCPHRRTETREGSKRQRLNKPENDLRG